MEISEAHELGVLKQYLAAHPEAGRILGKMMQPQDSSLWAEYCSVTPYRLGRRGEQYVKYHVRVRKKTGGPAIPAGKRGENYLREDLKARFAKAGTTLDFFVQLRTDPASMPLDNVTVPWNQEVSRPILVAQLKLPKQDLDDADAFDDLSFNPWHASADHEPMGSLNGTRRAGYVSSADVRRRLNGCPLAEPTSS
jgi:hypothetical protein